MKEKSNWADKANLDGKEEMLVIGALTSCTSYLCNFRFGVKLNLGFFYHKHNF